MNKLLLTNNIKNQWHGLITFFIRYAWEIAKPQFQNIEILVIMIIYSV
jgi:hypothetical protein